MPLAADDLDPTLSIRRPGRRSRVPPFVVDDFEIAEAVARLA